MSGLFETILAADANKPLFSAGSETVTAGRIRAMALQAAEKITATPGPVFLYTISASRFVAGLIGAARAERQVVLPAHVQPSYLAEIECPAQGLLDDAALPFPPERDAPAQAFRDLPRDLSLIFFTSGSTGAPKQIEKKLSKLEIEARALDTLWGAEAGVVRGTVSHQHIYGLLFRIMWPLLSGRLADDQAAIYWEEFAGKLDPSTTLISSPAHLTRLPPNASLFAAPPKLIFSSGQALPAEAAAACAKAFGQPVIEVLGSTETGGIAWRRQTSPDTPWRPFETVRISTDSADQLQVRSIYLPDDEPHMTGDCAIILANGEFALRPRGDRMEKIEGKRVSLTRVESVLTALPEINAVALVVLPARKQSLGAIVELSAAGRAALEQRGAFRMGRFIRTACAQTLEPAERPKHWRFVEAIPTDTQGKRVVSLLRAAFDEPDILSPLNLDLRPQSNDAAEISFNLAPDLIFFKGHFADHPVLPAVAQVHLAVTIAERIWQFTPGGLEVARMKFRHILQPEDRVLLKLKRDEEKRRLHFSYHLGATEASSGEIGRFTP